MAKIVLKNISVTIGGKIVLRNISFEFGEGVYVLFGRNGSGKTTLFRAIAGLVDHRGTILINDRDIQSFSRKELSRLIGYVWQNPYYGFIETSVKAEVETILKTLGVEGDWSIAEALVPRELWDRDPSTLSGGEARRVSIASILVADQPIWLLDEPFTNLDRWGVEALLRVLDIGRSKGKTILIALHEVFYAYLLKPDHYVLINNGEITGSGVWDSINDQLLSNNGLLTMGEVCAGYSYRGDNGF